MNLTVPKLLQMTYFVLVPGSILISDYLKQYFISSALFFSLALLLFWNPDWLIIKIEGGRKYPYGAIALVFSLIYLLFEIKDYAFLY